MAEFIPVSIAALLHDCSKAYFTRLLKKKGIHIYRIDANSSKTFVRREDLVKIFGEI